LVSSRGELVGKIGAEGLHADGLCRHGFGIAVKVLDGNSRALPAIVSRLIDRFWTPSQADDTLDSFRETALRNASGVGVGYVRLLELPSE
jgi:L-asparaginase II